MNDNLEDLYQKGRALKRKYNEAHNQEDILEAESAWREAADGGHSRAKLDLADMLSNQQLPNPRPNEAVRLLGEMLAECPESDPCRRLAAIDLGLMHCEGMAQPEELLMASLGDAGPMMQREVPEWYDPIKGWKLISKALETADAEDLPSMTVVRIAIVCSIGFPSAAKQYASAKDWMRDRLEGRASGKGLWCASDLLMAVRYFGLTAEIAAKEGQRAKGVKDLAEKMLDAHASRLMVRPMQEPPESRRNMQDEILEGLKRHGLDGMAERAKGEWGLDRLECGVECLKGGDYGGAIDNFGMAAIRDKDNAEAYSLRAFAYDARGWEATDDCGRAIADFDRAISILPKDAKLYRARAAMYTKKGLTGKAIEDLDRAIALDQGYDQAKRDREALLGAMENPQPTPAAAGWPPAAPTAASPVPAADGGWSHPKRAADAVNAANAADARPSSWLMRHRAAVIAAAAVVVCLGLAAALVPMLGGGWTEAAGSAAKKRWQGNRQATIAARGHEGGAPESAAGARFRLPKGYRISVAPSAWMSQKTHRLRLPWEGRLAHDVAVGGEVVWPAGTRVSGAVAKSDPNGFVLGLSNIGGLPINGGLYVAGGSNRTIAANSAITFEIPADVDITKGAGRGR
jgi:tetratricopeptide (TPR) repeat protein